jgi:hypothetical protein
MFHPEILPLEVQLPSLAVQLLFLAWVVQLIRKQRLSLRDSLLWLLSTMAAILVTAFPRLLVAGAQLVGVRVPSNAVFGIGLLYVTLNVLSVTIAASSNAARVRRLSQECALLRAELEAVRAEVSRRGAAERP